MTDANKERLRQLGWTNAQRAVPRPSSDTISALRKAQTALSRELRDIGGCLDPLCVVHTPHVQRSLFSGCACLMNPSKMRLTMAAYRRHRAICQTVLKGELP